MSLWGVINSAPAYILAGTATGAATGAALGSVLPVAGTVVGAGVGAGVGFFGSSALYLVGQYNRSNVAIADSTAATAKAEEQRVKTLAALSPAQAAVIANSGPSAAAKAAAQSNTDTSFAGQFNSVVQNALPLILVGAGLYFLLKVSS